MSTGTLAGQEVLTAVVSAASIGDNTLVAAVAKKRIVVVAGMLVATGGANSVRFESGAGGTALTGVMDLTADGQLPLFYNPTGHFEVAINTLLNLELSAATSVAGWLNYYLEDAQ